MRFSCPAQDDRENKSLKENQPLKLLFSVAGYHAVVCDAFISCLSYKHFRRFAPLKKINLVSIISQKVF